MSDHPNGYDLLKATIELSVSSLPIETKLDRILQCITDGFQSNRSLHLQPETILEEGFLSRVAREKKPLWVDAERPFREEGVLTEEKHLLCPAFGCIPLSDGTSFYGIFYIGFSKDRTFSSSEVELLLLLTKEIEAAIRNDRLHDVAEDHERRVKQLSTLWELNKALLTTVNFDRIVHITLTAITIGDGLGFNRAMLFLVDEKGHALQGTMAVGPNSAEEAGEIWSMLSKRKGNASDLVAHIESSTKNHSFLNSIVQEIQISLEHDQCILSRTVLEGRPFNIRFPLDEEEWVQTRCERGCALSSEVGCYVSEHLSRDPEIYNFATIPLLGKGKVIGVILVDNLFNQNPITEEDIHYLIMFSNQAGLSIENALLYRNLEEVHRELKEAQTFLVHREKMAALGELSTSIAHEVRNPLVSIGGFARRLDRMFPADASEKRYTRTIMKEVERVEKILSQFLTYTHEEPLALKELDLREVMEESLSMISEELRNEGVQLVKAFSEQTPAVKGDYYQLKQAFFNLISNAYESMRGEGRLSIRIHPRLKNGATFVGVEIEDTGGGIDPEALHHIFNPFYTTKDNRLGLGLPIIHKIVTSHRGQIEVNNHPGSGVTFILAFPA